MAICTLLVAAVISLPAGEQDAQPTAPTIEQTKVTLVLTAPLRGRFHLIEGTPSTTPSFANLIAGVDALRLESRRAGTSDPVVVAVGDTIRPHASARFALSLGRSGAQQIAAWLRRLGYDYVALSAEDFLSIPQRLHLFLEATSDAGLLVSAANLDCQDNEGAASALCSLLQRNKTPFSLVERNGLRIAIFSVIYTDLAALVPASNLSGVVVVDPLERARAVANAAIASGADLIVVVSRLDTETTSPTRAIDLARVLPDNSVVIAKAYDNGGKRTVSEIRFAGAGAWVITSPTESLDLRRVEITLEAEKGAWRVTDVGNQIINASAQPPEAAVLADLTALHASYHQKWDKPIGNGVLAEPMDADDLAQYLMEVLRLNTQSELVFIPRVMIDSNSIFPITGSLTRHAFFAAVPHRNFPYTFTVKGSELKALCASLPTPGAPLARNDVLARGIECGSSILVNGRTIAADDEVSAATVEYLAKGPWSFLADKQQRVQPFLLDGTNEGRTVCDLARDFLGSEKFNGDTAVPIDIHTNFPDLARELRWRFQGDLDFNLSDTQARNRPKYEESQLEREKFFSLRGEARGTATASSSLHEISVDGRIKYAKGRTEETDFTEIDDLDTLELIYKLNALRTVDSGWWVPIPYLGTKGETEMTQPEERDYHHLELTGTLGVRFPFRPELEAKIAAGIRNELFDPQAEPVLGIDFGYELKKKRLFSVGDSPLEMESVLTAFYGDWGISDTLKGAWVNRLYVSLVGRLFFNITHDLFFFSKEHKELALLSQLTFGLSLRGSTSLQSF